MIYDCFMFNDEFDLLDIRLAELAGTVEAFVLVEGSLTFQGDPKPWRFEERWEEYAAWPIIHIALATEPNDDPWLVEAAQRNAILKGLDDADPYDIVLVSDADEIPSAEGVLEAARLLAAGEQQIGFEQQLSFYHVNAVDRMGTWRGTQAVTAEHAFWSGPETIRRRRMVGPTIKGGWHFCNLGDADWLVEKLRSFSHTELDPSYQDAGLLAECIAEHREMTGRDDLDFEVRDPDKIALPAHLLRHRHGKYARLFAEVGVRS